MKRTSFFLPDDLRDRLAAESKRSGVPVAELVRRYLDAMTPPVTIGFGGLRRYVDRQGFMRVFVLSAREGKLLVEPGETGLEGLFKPTAEIWVDADLVRFEETQPALFVPPKPNPLADMLKLNIKATPEKDEPEEKS